MSFRKEASIRKFGLPVYLLKSPKMSALPVKLVYSSQGMRLDTWQFPDAVRWIMCIIYSDWLEPKRVALQQERFYIDVPLGRWFLLSFLR